TISTTSLPPATVVAPYSQAITVTGAVGPVKFAVTGGSLPDGLQLSPDGVISGVPTTATGATPASFTITATDSSGATASQDYSLTVQPLANVVMRTRGGTRKRPPIISRITLQLNAPISLQPGDFELVQTSGRKPRKGFEVNYVIGPTEVTISFSVATHGKRRQVPVSLPKGSYELKVDGIVVTSLPAG